MMTMGSVVWTLLVYVILIILYITLDSEATSAINFGVGE